MQFSKQNRSIFHIFFALRPFEFATTVLAGHGQATSIRCGKICSSLLTQKTVQRDRFVKATLVARLLRANFCSEETGAGKSYLNDHPTV